jgi:hypothetical protein
MSLPCLCLYISSMAMQSYIPNPCGTLSVFFASSFQVVSRPSDIISKRLISMWCQQGRQEHPPEVYNDQKTTSATSVNVTWTHLSYLLSFKLPPCMICSKLSCLTSICNCALYFSHYHIVHTLRGELRLYHASFMLVIWGSCVVRGLVDGRFLLWWVIDNVAWTNSWLSIAGAGCGLTRVGAGDEQAWKVIAGEASRCEEDK